MAENTPVPLNRIERTLAFMIVVIGGVAVLAIVAVFIATTGGVDLASGVWPVVATLPPVGLVIAFLLIVVFMILVATRRRRIARGGGH